MYNTEQVTLHTSLATCGNSVAPVSGGLKMQPRPRVHMQERCDDERVIGVNGKKISDTPDIPSSGLNKPVLGHDDET